LKKQLIGFIKLALSLGIGFGLVVWFLSQMSGGERQQVIEDTKRAKILWVIIPPLISLLSNYFRTQRWRLLLRPLGYNPRFLNTFLSVMIMYFLNLFIPRLGEVSRCGILARYEKVPMDKAIGTMVLERLTDLVCLLIVAILLVAFEHDKFIQLYYEIYKNSKATYGAVIAKYQVSPFITYGFLAALVLGFIVFLSLQSRKHGLQKIMKNLGERAMGLVNGIISIKDIHNPWEFLFHSVAIWVCYLLTPYFTFKMFPETSQLGILCAGVCLFFGGIAYSLTPGGLGLAPIFTNIILQLYGIAGAVAISVGWVGWGVQTIAVLAVGVVSFILIAIINREPSLKDVSLKT
jgi:glycosyltransferase 2 family protein